MKLIQRSALFAAILGLLALCAIAIYSYQLKRSADGVVRIAYELSQEGQPPTIQNLRQRFGSALRQPDPCTAYGCGYQLLLSNRVLSALHLVPYTALRSYFWPRNGVADQNSLEFWTVGRQGVVVLSYVEVKYCSRCDSFTISPWAESSPLGTIGSVEVGSASGASQKRVALALDTGCLTKLRGCTNIAELFPNMWQQTSARTIRCRISNHDGVVDNASYRP